jgi:hypothetical protein
MKNDERNEKDGAYHENYLHDLANDDSTNGFTKHKL